jgi:hypothetical protein
MGIEVSSRSISKLTSKTVFMSSYFLSQSGAI